METKEQPRVRKFYVEYEDGSTDQIVLNMSGAIPLYVFIRNQSVNSLLKNSRHV